MRINTFILLTLFSISTSLIAAPRFTVKDASFASYYSDKNEARRTVSQHGLEAVIGNNVRRDGMIEAKYNTVMIETKNHSTVDFHGDELVNFTVDSASKNAHTSMNGQSASHVLDREINMSGVAEAKFFTHRNGEIVLVAH